jgi:hypothetical protein
MNYQRMELDLAPAYCDNMILRFLDVFTAQNCH